MGIRGFLFIIMLVFIFSKSPGQELPTLPPSIKWQQINSAHFNVIFPKGYESEAQRTTNMLEGMYEPASRSLGSDPRKFPVLLQNYYSIPNGFVTVAPYRAEFFMFAPQDYNSIGNDGWLEHIASHEYRHIVQFEKAITPFNKAMYFLFGEFGPAAWASLAAPSWFWEGDAVGVETAMGRSGRGRTPQFTMAFRANTVDKGGFNYYKQHLRSFRDFVPNHYLTGYLMTTELKNKYGPDVWGAIVDKSFRAPFIPFAFSNAIKKETGQYLVKTYKEMMEGQKAQIQQQLDAFAPTPFDRISQRKNEVFTNYDYPVPLKNGQVLCVKSGYSTISQLVLLDQEGDEKKVLELGIYNDAGYLSANDSVVVWVEYEFDPRWFRRTYSVIKKYNFITGKKVTLSHKSRYSTAAIAPDGKIIAIAQSTAGENSIHWLDNKGQVIKVFDNPKKSFYSMPDFVDNGREMVVLKHYDGGKGIVRKSLATGDEQVLAFSTVENLGKPVIHGQFLYYSTAVNGIDNLFAMDLGSQEHFQITQSRFGAFHASPTSDFLFYNDYTADGMDVARSPLKKSKWIAKKGNNKSYKPFFEPMVKNEGIDNVLYNPPARDYQIEDYPKLKRSFRPTSWGVDLLPVGNSYGAFLQSRDLLGTTAISLGTRYNRSEKIWRYSGKVSYQALYPIIDVGFDVGKRTDELPVDDEIERFIWTENSLFLGLRVPFVLTNSNYLRKINLGVKSEITKVSDYDAPVRFINQPANGHLYTLEMNASYLRLRKRSKLDLASKWGQTVAITYKKTPFGGDYHSALFAAESNLFFPGLFRHHSFRLRGSFQKQDNSSYAFSSPIIFTRGYGYRSYDRYVNLSVNYKLPLLYMDWHIGPLINFQRVYANIFYDRGLGQDTGSAEEVFESIGAEVFFNINIMRFLPLLDLGFRYSYLPTTNTGMTEFIIGGITF